MSVMLQDDSAIFKAKLNPVLMKIAASQDVSLDERIVQSAYEPGKHIMYYVPDEQEWNRIATKFRRIPYYFQWKFGRLLRKISTEFQSYYGRGAKVEIWIHKDSVIDLMLAVAKVLLRQGAIQATDMSIRWVPGVACKTDEPTIRFLAKMHGIPATVRMGKVSKEKV